MRRIGSIGIVCFSVLLAVPAAAQVDPDMLSASVRIAVTNPRKLYRESGVEWSATLEARDLQGRLLAKGEAWVSGCESVDPKAPRVLAAAGKQKRWKRGGVTPTDLVAEMMCEAGKIAPE